MSGHILLADDFDRWGTTLPEDLGREGYEVRCLSTGKDVLAAVGDDTDLILLNTALPDGDGFETFESLRDNPLTCRVPVILLSGLSDVATKIQGLQMGAEDFIIRPFQNEEMLARVVSILKRFPRRDRRRRSGSGRGAELTLLRALVERGVETLTPKIDARAPMGFTYAEAADALGAKPGEEFDALDRLAGEHYLARTFHDRVHLCPACRHYNMNFRTLCPHCESAAIDPVETLHHFQCDHIDAGEAFRVAGAMRCPKCRARMRVEDADYERVQDHFQCRACDRLSPHANFAVTCFECGAVSAEDEVQLQDIWRYELTAKARLAAASGESDGLTLEGALTMEHREVLALADLREEVRRELDRGRRYGRPFTLAVVSIDQYADFLRSSEITDPVSYFRRVVQTIRDATRGTDVIGEFREDAVVILMPETDIDGAGIVCDRLRNQVSAITDPQTGAHLTLSIGLASSIDEAVTVRSLFDDLARAHRAARAEGGNAVSGAA